MVSLKAMPITRDKLAALSRRMTALGIKETDLEEKFILGSGPGGQKINKTASTVYLKHVPSGIEIKCQRERSQELNRYRARIELCERLEKKLLGIKMPKEKKAEKARKQKKRRERRARQKEMAG